MHSEAAAWFRMGRYDDALALYRQLVAVQH